MSKQKPMIQVAPVGREVFTNQRAKERKQHYVDK